jgi:hypothetical protein
MLEINDYSSRRGVIVPLLPKIHAMLKENAENDKLAGLEPPEHVITWTQKMRKDIVDINRRFFVALDGANLAGILFYRYDGTDIYIEDLHVAWPFRHNAGVIEGFIKRLEFDGGTKDAKFFASDRVKIESDKEILESKGFKSRGEGWETLGTFKQTVAALKLRYNRGVSI